MCHYLPPGDHYTNSILNRDKIYRKLLKQNWLWLFVVVKATAIKQQK